METRGGKERRDERGERREKIRRYRRTEGGGFMFWMEYNRTLMNKEHMNTTPKLN